MTLLDTKGLVGDLVQVLYCYIVLLSCSFCLFSRLSSPAFAPYFSSFFFLPPTSLPVLLFPRFSFITHYPSSFLIPLGLPHPRFCLYPLPHLFHLLLVLLSTPSVPTPIISTFPNVLPFITSLSPLIKSHLYPPPINTPIFSSYDVIPFL